MIHSDWQSQGWWVLRGVINKEFDGEFDEGLAHGLAASSDNHQLFFFCVALTLSKAKLGTYPACVATTYLWILCRSGVMIVALFVWSFSFY